MKYISRNTGEVVDAKQWKVENLKELQKFLPLSHFWHLEDGNQISISSLDSDPILLDKGDWLVFKSGKAFVVKEEFFAKFYKPRQKIVLLNGAPKCGKDTIANLLKNEVFGEGAINAFKDQLYKATADFYGLPLDRVIDLCTDRHTKETPNAAFPINTEGYTWVQKLKLLFDWLRGKINSLTPRQALIYVSESIYKPKFGVSFFGDCLLKAVEKSGQLYNFIPDSGFVDEIPPLVNAGHEVIVLQIHRDGCTFDGDSRSYITQEQADELGIKLISLDNNGTIEDLVKNLTNFALDYIL